MIDQPLAFVAALRALLAAWPSATKDEALASASRRQPSVRRRRLAQIPQDCHWLTVHDVSHCHQLWHVASAICGSEYILNPLEGFVFGSAFLIHDAGLTAGAYEGGIKALKDTVSYKEKLSIEVNRDLGVDAPARQSIEQATEIQKSRALFALLRELHAHRAQELLNQQYRHPVLKLSWTLVPLDLLSDVGEIIGKVAASHHWNIGRVDREFREPATPLASFPEWTIDALKLGCILRCADACAIDERLSPVMAFVLEEPLGESRDHWLFQSHLKPAYLRSGEDALVFESKHPFRRDSMDSWWLAYDGINLADRELRDADRLLKRQERQGGRRQNIALAAKRVEGAGNPAILKGYVTVDGWTPVETKVRISDPSALVELFGGKQLYGNDFTAPIRELIQNAADAVRNRRLEQGYGASSSEKGGEIKISILNSGSHWVLQVIDDGLGMPGDVMTGEFLDFGKSLWRSDRLASLYPGLISNPKFNPTGRFGIGFYASFMLGRRIKVMSKPYDGGLAERKVLHFVDVRGRAEFRAYDSTLDGNWGYGESTIIEVDIKDEAWVSRVARLSLHGRFEKTILETEAQFWDFFLLTLKRLAFCLDVRVLVTTRHSQIMLY